MNSEIPSYGCKFVKDITVPDNSAVECGAKLTKVWLVRNSGKEDWPSNLGILKTGKGTLEPVSEDTVPALKVGQEGPISVDILVPEEPGVHRSFDYNIGIEGKKFGDKFWAVVTAALKKNKIKNPPEDCPGPPGFKVLSACCDVKQKREFVVGEKCTWIWTIKNESKTTWPYMRLGLSYAESERDPTLPRLNAGEQCEMRYPFEMPVHPGDFHLCFTIRSLNGEKRFDLPAQSIKVLPLRPLTECPFEIIVKDLTGSAHNVEVNPYDSILTLKQKIQTLINAPPERQRIIYAGKQTEEALSIGHYNIAKGSTVHVVLRLDIGEFGMHTDSPGRSLLCNPETLCAEIDTYTLAQLIRHHNGNEKACFECDPKIKLLTEAQCQIVRDYLDDLHKETLDDVQDLKVSILPSQLLHLLGDEKLLGFVTKKFSFRDFEIKLRRCAAHGKHINFHTDHAIKTLQIPLIHGNEYCGGDLVYLNCDGIHVPDRPSGSYTIHDNTIVHGVSELRSGVRYGMFFLVQPADTAA